MAPDITVVELAPDRLDDYLALFDSAFVDNPHWDGCFCAYYDDPCCAQDWRPGADATAHRRARTERIGSGVARGLLAYVGSLPVGWCNASPRSSYGNLRDYALAIDDPADDPALVMCFVVRPAHRGQGVATALVHEAVAAAARWGSPWLEAYPRKPEPVTGALPWSAVSYKGPLGMYLAAGFRIVRDVGPGYVVRHDLGRR